MRKFRVPWPNIAYKILSAQEDKLLNFSRPNRIRSDIAVKSMFFPSLFYQSVQFLEAKDRNLIICLVFKFKKVCKHFPLNGSCKSQERLQGFRQTKRQNHMFCDCWVVPVHQSLLTFYICI